MSDRSLGSVIFAIGLIGAIVYALWLFWPASTNDLLFYCPGVGRWAVVVPLFVAVLAVLLIAMWIGWTMAVTPPPMPIEGEVEAKTEEKAGEKKEGT